jgi:hypothetical protein
MLTDKIIALARERGCAGFRSIDFGEHAQAAGLQCAQLARAGRLAKLKVSFKVVRYFLDDAALQEHVRQLGLPVSRVGGKAGEQLVVRLGGVDPSVRIAKATEQGKLPADAPVVIPPGVKVQRCPSPAYERAPADAPLPLRPGAMDYRRVPSVAFGVRRERGTP